jgi:triacylglycerol lipase
MKIVLLPGFPDFTNLGMDFPPDQYFRGVTAMLKAAGFEVFPPQVGPFGTPVQRSMELFADLTEAGVFEDPRKAHIIAHSAGGLDARYLVSPDAPNGPRLAAKFRSITMISTPHRGTPTADLVSGAVAGTATILPVLLERFPHLEEGVRGLTTAEMTAFNDTVHDAPDIEYFSYAGVLTVDRILQGSVFAPTQPLFVLDGANDGWVSVRSAIWGEFRATVAADHAEEIGYDLSPAGVLPFGVLSRPFDHFALYMRIANEIRLLGE